MTDALINAGRPFTRAGASTIGLSSSAMRAHIASQRLRRIFMGVYVDSTVPDSRRLRAAALHLVKPKGGVFYGATVAFLHGVDAFPPRDRFNFKPQCIVPHHTGRSKRNSVICHEGYLPPEDLEEVEGLMVTNKVRTTVDMMRSLWRPHALAAADAMAHANLVTREEAMSYIAKMKRYPGIVQARALAVLIEPKVESPGESWQRLRLADAGFPVPESQIVIFDQWGEEIARIDNGYRDAKVGTEYDGREWHDDDRAGDRDDKRRGFLESALGWRLLPARHADIFGDDPKYELQIGEWLGISPGPRIW
jgi:hypothetical protein